MAVGPYWVGDRPNDALSLAVVRNGQPVDLSAYAGATATLTGPQDTVIDSSGIGVELASDRVVVDWPDDETLFTEAGPYTLQIVLNAPGGEDHTLPVEFWVYAPEPTVDLAWADRRDVLNLTGQSVDGSTLLQAQGVIELECGTSYAATRDATRPTGSKLKARDRRLLKQAVAYQAAFLAHHEAVFSRAGLASINQDGFSASAAATSGGTDITSFTVAPLARRALAQLSWNGGDRTIHVRKARPRGEGSLAALEDAWVRDEAGVTIWQPIDQQGRFPGYLELPAGTTERGV